MDNFEHMDRTSLLKIVSDQQNKIDNLERENRDLKTDLESLQVVVSGGVNNLRELRLRDQQRIHELEQAVRELRDPLGIVVQSTTEEEKKMIESGTPILPWDKACIVGARVWLQLGPDPSNHLLKKDFRLRPYPEKGDTAQQEIEELIEAVLSKAIVKDDVKTLGLDGVSPTELRKIANYLRPLRLTEQSYYAQRSGIFKTEIWPKMKSAGYPEKKKKDAWKEFKRKLDDVNTNANNRWKRAI